MVLTSMIDPDHKTAAAVGFGGAGISKILDYCGFHDWASLAAFLTCVLVLLQIIGWILDRFGPEKWKRWRKK